MGDNYRAPNSKLRQPLGPEMQERQEADVLQVVEYEHTEHENFESTGKHRLVPPGEYRRKLRSEAEALGVQEKGKRRVTAPPQK